MGSTNGDKDEKPVHRVTIGYSFYIGKYEITQEQWRVVMGTTVREQHDKSEGGAKALKGGEGDDWPMYWVNQSEADDFIVRLNKLNDGYVYSLPTEAEWEYACRGGTVGDYAGALADLAWYSDNSGGQIHVVGTKRANAFGLFDMHGNVWEWCEDTYHDSYAGAPTDGSAWRTGGDTNSRVVLRGGSSFILEPAYLRSASRIGDYPILRRGDSGFRVVAVARTQVGSSPRQGRDVYSPNLSTVSNQLRQERNVNGNFLQVSPLTELRLFGSAGAINISLLAERKRREGLPANAQAAGNLALPFDRARYSRRYLPVCDAFTFMISSGVPVATT